MANDCIKHVNDKIVAIGDGGSRKIYLLNSKKHPFVVYHVDGCMVSNTVAADRVVKRQGIGDLIIELKGRNVEHGADQVYATATYWTNNDLRCGKISAVIVAARFPRADTIIQRKQAAFYRAFRGKLRVVCSKKEFSFDQLMD